MNAHAVLRDNHLLAGFVDFDQQPRRGGKRCEDAKQRRRKRRAKPAKQNHRKPQALKKSPQHRIRRQFTTMAAEIMAPPGNFA
jgi:hypothetical protein